MIIDATNLILGRIASYTARKALLGERIDIINCENAVISGNKIFLLKKYHEKMDRGDVYKGPHFKKMPHLFVKRAIRGMLPYKTERGMKAYRRIVCHIGIPTELNGKKAETLEKANIGKTKRLNYLTVGKLCDYLGKQ